MIPIDAKNIGKAFRVMRKAKKLKQREISAATGLSVSYISDLERDRRLPTLNAVVKLAEFYGYGVRLKLVDPGTAEDESKLSAVEQKTLDCAHAATWLEKELRELTEAWSQLPQPLQDAIVGYRTTVRVKDTPPPA